MNEKNWDSCLSEGSVEAVKGDSKKANSLRRTAKGRINFFNKQKISSENINYIFEGFYTSVVELLHYIVTEKGYKVSNHICLGYFLRDVLKREDLFRIFDDLRYKRNSIVYYGTEMDFETAKQAVENCKKLIKELE